jgi:hypothetical protein
MELMCCRRARQLYITVPEVEFLVLQYYYAGEFNLRSFDLSPGLGLPSFIQSRPLLWQSKKLCGSFALPTEQIYVELKSPSFPARIVTLIGIFPCLGVGEGRRFMFCNLIEP